ncbi:MAG: DUF1653 domain-containing protein [Lachnospiraceae bacterium]|nr:DUF1653 domain-containing protein [Lachnospiraceae bacterium]
MENRSVPVAGELYRHFKNKMYQIVTIAKHSETGERMVVYQALYGDYGVYVRPFDRFMSEVDHEKYPDIQQKYRFERVTIPGDGQAVEPEQNKTAEKTEGDSRYENKAAVESQQPAAADMKPMGTEALMNFLDADTYAEKLNILRGMKKYIDDKMAYDMAVSLDIVLKEEPLEEKIRDLENCLKTYARFECNRFR